MFGMYALAAADNAVRPLGGFPDAPESRYTDMPLLRRFFKGDTPRQTKYGDQLYDLLNESNALFSTINRLKTRGFHDEARELRDDNRGPLRARKKLNAIQTSVRNINKRMTMVYSHKTMTAEEKRDALDELQRLKNKTLQKVEDVKDFF